jgi:glutamyl endopeptidase
VNTNRTREYGKLRRPKLPRSSGFRKVLPPVDLTPGWGSSQSEADLSKMRVRQSFMVETHLGGIIEQVPGFDAWRAMTHGMGSRIRDSRPIRSRGYADKELIRASSEMERETLFDEGDAWVRIPDVSTVPWRCICYLESTYMSGRLGFGTGWLVSADTIITAGHNVFSAEGDGWAQTVRVTAGSDAGFAFGETYAEHIDAYPGWVDSGGKARDCDLGMLKLADRTLGNRAGWFGFAVFTDTDLRTAPLIQSAGYPAETKPRGTLWFDAGRVTTFDAAFVHYRIDTEKGQSGSPIFFTNKEGQRWVMATHVYGQASDNLGLRVTEKFMTRLPPGPVRPGRHRRGHATAAERAVGDAARSVADIARLRSGCA